MNPSNSLTRELVTTVISHRVKPGRREGYEEWLKGVTAVARTFEGYLGVSIFRPQPNGPLDYVLVVQFFDCDCLLNWLHSDTRREWLARVAPLLVEPEKIQTLTGLEAWFDLPTSLKIPSGPKRYKQAILVWVGVMAVSLLRQPSVDPLFAGLPPIAAMGCSAAVTVAALTYFVMPQLTRIFKGWLYPTV